MYSSDENMDAVADYLCYLNIITYKFSQELRPLAKLIFTLLEESGDELIIEIKRAFTTIMFEADQAEEEGQNNLTLFEIIESQIELMTLFMQSVYSLKKFI